MNSFRTRSGFTLVELLIVVAIISILTTIGLFNLNIARVKAEDASRKAAVSQTGRILTVACPLPTAGAGDYDLSEVAASLVAQYPQYEEYIHNLPRDPKSSGTTLGYRYTVDTNGKCALYANLLNTNDPSGLSITAPTPGGGTGVFTGATQGVNGTTKFFQVSN